MNKVILYTFIIIVAAFLSGCSGGGGMDFAGFVGDFFSSGAGGDDGFYVASAPSGGSGSGDSTGTTYYDPGTSGGDSGGDTAGGHHNPEPASIALLGAGLFGLLGSRLRKKRGR